MLYFNPSLMSTISLGAHVSCSARKTDSWRKLYLTPWSLPLCIFLAAKSDSSTLSFSLRFQFIFSFDRKSLFVIVGLRKRSGHSALCFIRPLITGLINSLREKEWSCSTHIHQGFFSWFVITVWLKNISFKKYPCSLFDGPLSTWK